MDGGVNQWLYLAACLLVPAAWGVFSAWLFSRADRKAAEDDRRPPVDYVI